jgi:hypothetical protein
MAALRSVLSGLRQLCFWAVLVARATRDLGYIAAAPQLLNSVTSISTTESIMLTAQVASQAVGGETALAQLTSLLRLSGVVDLLVVLGTALFLGSNNAGMLVSLIGALVQLNATSGSTAHLATVSAQQGYSAPVFGPWDKHALHVQAGMALVLTIALALPSMHSSSSKQQQEQTRHRVSNPFGSLLVLCCVVSHAAVALGVLVDLLEPVPVLMFGEGVSFSPLGEALQNLAALSLAASLLGAVLLLTVPRATSGSLVVLMTLHSVLGVRAFLFVSESDEGAGHDNSGFEGMVATVMNGQVPVSASHWMYAHSIVASLGFLALVTLPTDDDEEH